MASVVAAIGLACATGASATVFCAPDTSFAGCPAGSVDAAGSGAASIESAMSTNGSDGIADTVYIGPGTFVNAATFKAGGSDALTVIGSGRDQTVLTTSATGNVFVVDLYAANTRSITMRNLAILVPASFPDSGGSGAAVQANRDAFESIDVITDNSHSDAFASLVGGARLVDTRVFGRNGARFGRAIGKASCQPGELTIERSSIADSDSGLSWDCPTVPVSIDRTTFRGTDSAISVENGAQLSATNMVIESGDQTPIEAYNGMGAGTTSMTIDSSTIVATGDVSKPAIMADVANSPLATSSIALDLRNSIVTGFAKPWELTAPVNPARGDVSLVARYSSFGPTGTAVGDVTVDQATGNISDNPGFAGVNDFHLAPGSPAIDAGDPSASSPAVDLDGALRPLDGNGDGLAVRDIGAFEAPALPLVDKTSPRITRYRLRYSVRKGGYLKFTLSEKAAVKVRFTPRSKRGKTFRITRTLKAGAAKLKIGKRRLKKGRYKLRIVATDSAGNKSKTFSRTVKIRS